MAGELYCAREDLYRFGVARGALSNPGRLLALAVAATNVLELDGHGFEDGTELLFRAEAGGSLPSPLVAGTTYYALPLTDATFQVAATDGGAAIDITTAGESILVTAPLPIDAVIERYSRFVDDHLPAHLVPLTEPLPVRVAAIVAELSAQRLMWISGQRSIAMQDIEAAAHKELERWSKGLPLRDSTATARTNLAVARAVTGGGRGWDTSDGSIP